MLSSIFLQNAIFDKRTVVYKKKKKKFPWDSLLNSLHLVHITNPQCKNVYRILLLLGMLALHLYRAHCGIYIHMDDDNNNVANERTMTM